MELLLKKLLPLLPEHVRQRLESMLLSGIGKRLSGGAFWSIAGSAVQYLCILVALMVCAKILGKENFGKLNLVQNTSISLLCLARWGWATLRPNISQNTVRRKKSVRRVSM